MKIIEEFLQKLGFGAQATALFVALTQNGPLTLLEASRHANLERTKLYRLVDELKDRGLIEEIPAYKRRTIKAASLSTLEMMVREQEVKSKSLTGTLPAFSQAIQNISHNLPMSNVIYYKGIEGSKQMAWRILRCKGLWRAFSYNFWEDVFGQKFAISFDNEMSKKQVKCHNIYSDQYISYRENWRATHKEKPAGVWSYMRSKLVSEKILKIDQNIDIYNDIVAYSYWSNNEVFGVEIQNERVAEFHKQNHDLVWNLAKPMKHLAWLKNRKSTI